MGVQIQFINDVPEPYEAFVILRDNEMVIDMPATDEYPPYLIKGKQVQHYYVGENSAGQQPRRVHAKWASLGRVYVGQWNEEGQEYLFSFQLNE